jgi:hypothetical protein
LPASVAGETIVVTACAISGDGVARGWQAFLLVLPSRAPMLHRYRPQLPALGSMWGLP